MKPKILVLERSTELADTIREVAAGIDPEVLVVACNRVGAVGDVLHQEGPFTVLFAGPSLASRSGLRRLAALHEESPATSLVLAFSDRPDASLREIVQAGADDILRLPFDHDDLTIALERALDIGGRRQAGATPKTPPGVIPLPVAPQVPTQAKVFTVSSATGGCGPTTRSTTPCTATATTPTSTSGSTSTSSSSPTRAASASSPPPRTPPRPTGSARPT